MSKTTVVNMHVTQGWDVRIDRMSMFGNPFKVGIHGTRAEVVEMYQEHFNKMITYKGFRDKVIALRGKRLGCWCKPEGCHGDILIKLLKK